MYFFQSDGNGSCPDSRGNGNNPSSYLLVGIDQYFFIVAVAVAVVALFSNNKI